MTPVDKLPGGTTNIGDPLPSMLVKTDHTAAIAARMIGDLLGLYKHRKKKAWIHYICVSSPLRRWVDPQ